MTPNVLSVVTPSTAPTMGVLKKTAIAKGMIMPNDNDLLCYSGRELQGKIDMTTLQFESVNEGAVMEDKYELKFKEEMTTWMKEHGVIPDITMARFFFFSGAEYGVDRAAEIYKETYKVKERINEEV